MSNPQLDIKKEFSTIRELYSSQQIERLISALIIGTSGVGKTRLLETCPRPIHVDSFDPKGTTTIRKGIEEGWILADTRYEIEDPTDPYAFELWDNEYNRRKDSGYFSNIGTYALDSLTLFGEAIMNLVLKGLVRKADRKPGTSTALKTDYLRIPQENDYPLQMNILKNCISDILSLPCNVIIIGHLENKTDREGKVLSRGLYVTGKLATRLPRLFEEIYHLKTEDSSKGPQYYLLTQPEGGVEARTRIGRDKFAFREVPDICYLLEKAGLKPKHKEF